MLKRTITAVIAAAILAVVCYFSGTVAFPIAMGFAALVGTYEMLGCIGARRNFTISISMYALAIIATVMTRTVSKHSLYITGYAALVFCILIILLAVAVFSRGAVPFEKTCVAFTSCAYVITGFMCIVLLRDMPGGIFVYLLAFIGPCATDTFAYFTGVLFGRHKLIPEISPKKTIEGSIGGIVFCVIFCTAYGLIVKNAFNVHRLPPVYIFSMLGLMISVISQIGDLIMSLIKRKYGIKDFGFIFPGHGGILDRFDSIIAASPLILMFFEATNKLNLFK